MHVTRVEIQNIRSLEQVTIELTPEEAPGWHVFIGSNASGKTTVLRSIALGLIGSFGVYALRENWMSWVKTDCYDGLLKINTIAIPKIFSEYLENIIEINFFSSKKYLNSKRYKHAPPLDIKGSYSKDLSYFSMSFGPFRRFGGAGQDAEKIAAAVPTLAPHLTLFGEDIALSAGLETIQKWHIKGLEGDRQARTLVDRITRFVKVSKLLPFDAEIVQVKSDAIVIRDGNGNEISIEQMSSGFKSVLSLFFEIVHQMAVVFGEDGLAKAINLRKGTIDLPGVVCIDEVDAHLHPSWQRDIGFWFTRRFPQLQFFVTTHSPIICRAARSVWKLPDPGTGDPVERVTGDALNRLIYGSIIDAYGTELFGANVAESEKGREASEELSKLNRKSLTGRLKPADARRMRELRAMLPSRSSRTALE